MVQSIVSDRTGIVSDAKYKLGGLGPYFFHTLFFSSDISDLSNTSPNHIPSGPTFLSLLYTIKLII